MFRPAAFHPNRPTLVGPVRADPTGRAGPTRGQARGPGWRSTSCGLVVPTAIEHSPAQRIVEAAAVLRDGEAVTGWAALHWITAPWFEGRTGRGTPRAVPLVTRRHVRAQSGFAVSQEYLPPTEIVVVDGLPVTVPARSVAFEMRYAGGLDAAVTAVDMACYSDAVSLAELTAYVGALGPVTGIQQARDAVALGDENAWSPREVTMRQVWTGLAGRPRPLCNVPVFTLDGRHVATPDLLDPVAGVAGEYDGSLHLEGEQRGRDLAREADLRRLGLEPVVMVAADWPHEGRFVARLHDAYGRADRRTGPPRWTLDAPPWWTRTETVAQRRALESGQRERWLRHRLPRAD
jgi:hypothetical protein